MNLYGFLPQNFIGSMLALCLILLKEDNEETIYRMENIKVQNQHLPNSLSRPTMIVYEKI